MKCVVTIMTIFLLLVVTPRAHAQDQELMQLAYDIEKLAQFKQILKDLQQGYQILTKGYNTIKDLSQGNFNLHKLFLDGLLAVNPSISNYKRVADIINYELKIVQEYKKAFNHFKISGVFQAGELDYLGKVYSNLIDRSLKNLEDLVTIITTSRLRMNDAERLAGIDHIYEDMSDMWQFLQSFDNSTTILALQRTKEKNDADKLRSIYDLKK